MGWPPARSEAVGRDHKLAEDGNVVAGRVGQDRIQATGQQSIGEAIRYWYCIDGDHDFERIDVEASIHPEGHLILVPTAVLMRGAKRKRVLEKVASPLSFHRDYQSKLWRQQIDARRKESAVEVAWAATQISGVVADHGDRQ